MTSRLHFDVFHVDFRRCPKFNAVCTKMAKNDIFSYYKKYVDKIESLKRLFRKIKLYCDFFNGRMKCLKETCQWLGWWHSVSTPNFGRGETIYNTKLWLLALIRTEIVVKEVVSGRQEGEWNPNKPVQTYKLIHQLTWAWTNAVKCWRWSTWMWLRAVILFWATSTCQMKYFWEL